MTDYAWFAIKGIGYLTLIGFACWVTESGMPLWALVFMPSWGKADDREWVGLTADDMETLHWSPDFRAGALWAEQKLKGKNS